MQASTINDNFIEKNINTNLKSEVIKLQENKKSGLKKVLYIILGVLIVILACVLIYGLFLKKSSFINPIGKEGSDASDKDKAKSSTSNVNPINGTYLSDEDLSRIGDKKPIAVMVNNYVAARPSNGLTDADIVYEAVAEGGITRLMPIFYSKIPSNVGSVRSARYYFVEIASGYNAHYIHWGAAHVPPCQKLPATDPKHCKPETDPSVDAYDKIVKLGVPNLDGGNYEDKFENPNAVFVRDPVKLASGMPREHTANTRLNLIYDLAKKIRKEDSWHKFIPFKEWIFKDEASVDKRGEVGLDPAITYNYWATMPGFNVKWDYDKSTNEYVRTQGDVKQIDANNNKELRAKVVVIRFTEEKPVGDKKNHLFHTMVGKGAALIFQDGKVIKGFWNRTKEEERDTYVDQDNKPVEFNRGQIWVQLVPQGNEVKYEKTASTKSSASEKSTTEKSQ